MSVCAGPSSDSGMQSWPWEQALEVWTGDMGSPTPSQSWLQVLQEAVAVPTAPRFHFPAHAGEPSHFPNLQVHLCTAPGMGYGRLAAPLARSRVPWHPPNRSAVPSPRWRCQHVRVVRNLLCILSLLYFSLCAYLCQGIFKMGRWLVLPCLQCLAYFFRVFLDVFL